MQDQGVSGVFVASGEFVDAAETQARSLGIEASAVFVRHPIQDRTDAEMREIAEDAFERLVVQLIDEG